LLRQKIANAYPWLKFAKNTKPIWLHCSSMEFEYAKPVIREIKRQNPAQKIIVTYFSPSAQRAVEGFAGVDFACPLPWDFWWVVKEFIDYHKPKMLLYARTDVWPEVTVQCLLHGIPTLLFSATLTQTSSRLRVFSLGFTRWCYSLITKIFSVSQSDQNNFKRAGIERNCLVLGDTRYDQVLYRLQNPKVLKNIFPTKNSSLRTVVFGSTWPEDECVIFAAIEQLKNKNLCFVIVPHEATAAHMQNISQHKIVRYSLFNGTLKLDDVLVIDQVGILAELYTHADLAFVGGSFKKNVHSVMEPLAAGNVTLVGPYYENNREAVEFQEINLKGDSSRFPLLARPVGVIKSSADLTKYLSQLSDVTAGELSLIRDEIKGLVQARAGVTRKLMNKIMQEFS